MADNRTVALVDKLIAWTIETGVVTSAAMLVTLICFVTMKGNYIWLGCFVVTARSYSIFKPLLANLNSRASLRAMNDLTQLHFELTSPSVSGTDKTSGREGL
ncbi:hypothetical protein FB451DRAFT_142098 [Mycena latifolia]|nr:hypothetical protein FB451DRAFT_142098 [Mycena latifolia]